MLLTIPSKLARRDFFQWLSERWNGQSLVVLHMNISYKYMTMHPNPPIIQPNPTRPQKMLQFKFDHPPLFCFLHSSMFVAM